VTFRGRSLSPAVLGLSLSLVSLGFLVLIALVLAVAGVGGPVSAPGRFLTQGFSWAAFLIPLYFAAAVALLVSRVFRLRLAVMLTLSVLPFLTFSLLLHVVSASPLALPQLLLSVFGELPAAILLFLVLLIELLFLLTLPFGMATAMQSGRTAIPSPRKPLELPAPEESLDPLREGFTDIARTAPAVPVVEEVYPAAILEAENEEEPAAPGGAAAGDGAAAQLAFTQQPAPADEPSHESAHAAARGAAEAAEAGLDPVRHPSQPELPFAPGAGGRAAYAVPMEGLLKHRGDDAYWIVDEETRRASRVLTDALQEFNIQAEVTGIRKGPVITLFEVLPAPGVRVSKIANLSDNIALRLAAPSVRIVAPIPGKHAVGIEVPNKRRAVVSFKEMISLDSMQKSNMEIPVALGKDILGEAQVIDLVQTPHLLIGGATNSGKSVLVNAIICSILFRKSPDEVRMFMIDPKIVELKSYNGVPHLLTPVITEPKKAFQALQYCISEMERRYTLLDALAVRDIRAYNKKARRERVQRLPYIVIVIDEFADLMATTGKELESTLARLAAMARAVGIHMVLATQRPSIDVITGLIKANIPSRIAFMVANKFDSRIIIDSVGAEKLLGKGDMLFSAAWNPFPVRIQGALVDDEEIEATTEHLKKLGPPQYIDDEVFFDDEEEGDFAGEPGNDPLFERALEVVVSQGKASASYLQRRLKVGYNRAARLVEEMEMRGIVGPAQGSKPRDILHIPKSGG
jgi:DNA segregation ATPase FtsK/SpoIIIE, S-DNA-T family